MIFDENYVSILKDILENGIWKENRTGIRTKSVFTRILDAGEVGYNDIPISNLRKIYYKGALIETLWFLGLHANDPRYSHLPITNTKYLTDYNVHYWDPWANEFGNLGPVYGAQLTQWKTTTKNKVVMEAEDAYKMRTINQIQNIITTLRENPDSRRLITNLWNPGEIDNMALPPCHYGMQFFSYQNEDGQRVLDTTWIQRSCDMPIGIPYNVLQYTFINKLVSLATGHKPGRVRGVLGDCHIYENQIPMVEELIRRYESGEVQKCDTPHLRISDDLMLKSGSMELSDVKLDGSDFELLNYNPLSAIKIPVAV